ncbi:hypothetical protein H8356DRAFT_949309 [Neocallimastix lanati (nom. inval.)]|nr:hypothetical protein H8356DRAFT_949309 [Neocallimastix sp. JGI-2020a]
MVTFGRIGRIPKSIELIFILFEMNRLISIGSGIILLYVLLNIFGLLDFFDCSHNKNETNAKYICLNDYHTSFFLQNYIPLNSDFKSLISNNYIICYRRIVFIQILNIMLFKVYLNNKYITSIIMLLVYIFMFYKHLSTQYYYNSIINSFYSGLYFSMACQSLIYLIFSYANILNLYPVFFVFFVVGFIIGWILNNYYYKWYSSKIFDKIENKYNTRHVITRLKEEIEFNNISDERKSLDMIVSEKRVIKKENVYNKPSDPAIVSKFVIYNRSLEAFYLIISFFKEGINQFNRTLDVYIQFWNYLHGIQIFINLNKKFFVRSDFDELNDKITEISEKILYKCASLSNSIFEKYLVYNATLTYDTDQSLLNDGSKEGSINYDIIELKYRSVQYHLASLNLLKNLMESFKILDSNKDIEKVMIINDKLTDFLARAENFYNSYLIKGNFSKESLELYILFLRYSMNRSDLAEQYIQQLESNTEYENKDESNNINGNNYEKSEIMSSSINSESRSRKSKVLKNEMLHQCQKPLYKLLSIIEMLTTAAVIIGAIGYNNYFILYV